MMFYGLLLFCVVVVECVCLIGLRVPFVICRVSLSGVFVCACVCDSVCLRFAAFVGLLVAFCVMLYVVCCMMPYG